MELPFSKYSGCGNDFIMVNNLAGHFPFEDSNLIRQLCHRQLGIGADGVILLCKAEKGDFRMRIFNSDGTEAEMCGNGLRCLMQFIQEQGFIRQEYSIQTMHRLLKVRLQGEHVEMEMGSPSNVLWDVPVETEGTKYQLDCMNTGVPHAILFVKDVDGINVNLAGPGFRYHEAFAPKGTNMNFVEVQGNRLKLRTYERGVEQETLACGTGAAAAAIAAVKRFKLNLPVQVEFRSGDTVEVNFKETNGQIEDVIQVGPARKIFHGVIDFYG